MEKMKNYAPIILRIGMALVVLWFGWQQVMSPEGWTRILPAWTNSLPFSQIGFIYLNGLMELVTGVLLLAGFFTRIVSFILAIHLFSIALTLGYGAVAVRDIGLFFGLASVFLHGADSWSLDKKYN